jgi:hypothetical protein
MVETFGSNWGNRKGRDKEMQPQFREKWVKAFRGLPFSAKPQAAAT